MAELAPVDILASADHRQHRLGLPLRVILQHRHSDVEYWEDQIVSAERLLARQKRLKFGTAMGASDRGWCDDRDEEHCLLDGGFDLGFPKPARRDCLLVLPEAEIPPGTPELTAQLTLNAVPERGQ